LILGLSIIRFFWFVIVDFITPWPAAKATGQSRIHHFPTAGRVKFDFWPNSGIQKETSAKVLPASRRQKTRKGFPPVPPTGCWQRVVLQGSPLGLIPFLIPDNADAQLLVALRADVVSAQADGGNFFAGASERAERNIILRFRAPESRAGGDRCAGGQRHFYEFPPADVRELRPENLACSFHRGMSMPFPGFGKWKRLADAISFFVSSARHFVYFIRA
jgi:hypothetical protein